MTKIKKAFYERYWNEKESDELFDFSYKWPVLSKLLPNKRGLTLLDYGCGTGFLLSHIQKLNPETTYIGADISEAGLKRAKKNLPKINFILLKEGKPIKLKDRSVDFITCLDVIEHVYDTEAFVEDLYRILKPGGQLLISTPFHGLVKNIVIAFMGFNVVFDPTGPHIRFFTNQSLEQLLKKKGFIIQKTGYFGRIYPLSRGFYKLAVKE